MALYSQSPRREPILSSILLRATMMAAIPIPVSSRTTRAMFTAQRNTVARPGSQSAGFRNDLQDCRWRRTICLVSPSPVETMAESGGRAGAGSKAGCLYGVTQNYGHFRSGVVFECWSHRRCLQRAARLRLRQHRTEAIRSGGLAIDKAGATLYGTTNQGGGASLGTAFEIALGATPVLTTIHSFGGGGDANLPTTELVFDKAGNLPLYGTTGLSGEFDSGAVYKIAPDGTESVVYSFSPVGGLLGWTRGRGAGQGITEQSGSFRNDRLRRREQRRQHLQTQTLNEENTGKAKTPFPFFEPRGGGSISCPAFAFHILLETVVAVSIGRLPLHSNYR